MINVIGVVIEEFDANTNNGMFTINLDTIASGVYFVKCNDEKMIKVIKQN